MARKSGDSHKNSDIIHSQHNLNNIPTYFPRFSRKSYSERYGKPLVMTKASNVLDLDEVEAEENLKNSLDISKTDCIAHPDNSSAVINEQDNMFGNTNTNGLEKSIQYVSNDSFSDSVEFNENSVHISQELEQTEAVLSIQKSQKDKDIFFSPSKECSNLHTIQESNSACNISVCDVHETIDLLVPPSCDTYVEAKTTQEQTVEAKQENRLQERDDTGVNNVKECLNVSVDVSCDSLKDNQILQEKNCNHVTLDSNVSICDGSLDFQSSQCENTRSAEESHISFSVYPKEENMLPLVLPDDFSDQEKAYAALSIKEWEDKGLEISKRGFQLIEKVILLRRKKEELLFQVQNMINIHAEKLAQREESLRLRALDVKKRGKELLDDVSIY
ncbi:hypothetical protein PORY_002076 [Pneumocystis oryctolagi]|uniref:Uncharacterized protein n=1 Tax=Pneumocystis oryctolagi TaxID=42067 RepID=A0ACB7C9J2_9ASCO|nr:hypothetical protein PORY_002076 [Pneumocystis oryctolagi]